MNIIFTRHAYERLYEFKLKSKEARKMIAEGEDDPTQATSHKKRRELGEKQIFYRRYGEWVFVCKPGRNGKVTIVITVVNQKIGLKKIGDWG